ncbi:beta-L-arabinofuranosidase domain-containing protein [Cellulomonas sp.]|uniref:glycoside hydrolase family 127 protein n=1 Tax=Cellulomonas sp. TaxID=40001 RepID=UPI002583EA96|nr:beta-L-arabinofuranosidase domain-containing protein [Cellulomonas sp.]MCR6688883.1 glycoside hydrolase family 127 protein [Cellulomonas sp.]
MEQHHHPSAPSSEPRPPGAALAQRPLSRRTVLRAGALATAAVGLAGAVPGAFGGARPAAAAALPRLSRDAATAAEHVPAYPASWTVRPFNLTEVSLGESVFTRAQQQMVDLARAYPVDRVLVVFRRNANLDVKGASAPGGWEELGPAPDEQRWGPAEYVRGQNTRGAGGLLRGHYGGHFLSMLAMAYATTGDQAILDKVDDFVDGLEECRAALAATGRYSHPGFLAAYGEWQFSALEAYAPYGEIWAPWYTCHKILAGLIDAYRYTGSALALQLAEGLGRWTHARLSACTPEQLERMWGIYIGGEAGGMNDALVDLYTLSTAADRDDFLAAAALFDLRSLVTACAQDRDTLNGKHANMHIPTFVGYAKLGAWTGDATYSAATRNFFGMIVPGRMYAHGGTGEGEMWGPANTVAGDIGPRNAESCAAYNMLKVARTLFFEQQDAAYMDYYERTVLNHILGGKRDQASTTSPQNLYMFPVGPGARKEYGNGNIGTCCGGTGLESPVKYQDSIWFRSADDSALWVNLYIASELRWTSRGMRIVQEGDYPNDETVTLRIAEGAGELDLRLRVPAWATSFVVAVNGATVASTSAGTATPGTYVSVDRTWSTGDQVTITLALPLRAEATIDRPDIQSLQRGPVVLSALSSSTKYLQLSLYDRMGLDGSLSRGVDVDEQGYVTIGTQRFEPAFSGQDVAYHMYVQRSEKRITFAGVDSGAANPTRPDGTSFLDEVWSAAPFADRQELLERVQTTSAAWVAERLMSARDRQKVLVAVARAPFTRPAVTR